MIEVMECKHELARPVARRVVARTEEHTRAQTSQHGAEQPRIEWMPRPPADVERGQRRQSSLDFSRKTANPMIAHPTRVIQNVRHSIRRRLNLRSRINVVTT